MASQSPTAEPVLPVLSSCWSDPSGRGCQHSTTWLIKAWVPTTRPPALGQEQVRQPGAPASARERLLWGWNQVPVDSGVQVLGERAPSAGRGGAVQGRAGPPAAAAEGTAPFSGPAPLSNTRLAQGREHRWGPGSALRAGPHLCPRRGGWHRTDPAHRRGRGSFSGAGLSREGKQGWGAVDSSRGSGGPSGSGGIKST